MLEERFARRPWDVALHQAEPLPARPYVDPTTLTAFLDEEGSRLLAPLVAEEESNARRLSGRGSAFDFLAAGDPFRSLIGMPSAQKYRDSVRSYLAAIEQVILPLVTHRLVTSDLCRLMLEIENPQDEGLESVQVELELPDGVVVVESAAELAVKVPFPPPLWAEQRSGVSGSILRPGDWAGQMNTLVVPGFGPVVKRRGGSTQVRFPPVTVPAQRQREVAAISMLLAPETPAVVARWSATAANRTAQRSGDIEIRFGPETTIRDLGALVKASRRS
jgi:hypothetical protein